MSTPNDRDLTNETTGREVHRDAQGNVHITPPTSSSNPDPRPLEARTAYRAGYANGKLVENSLQREEQENLIRQDNQVVRDNDNAARGLLLGILLTSLVGLTVGAFALLNRRQPAPVVPVVVPNTSPAPAAVTSPSPSPATNRETTVIERTTQVVPVPQPGPIQRVVVPAPAPQAPAASPASPLPQGTIVVPSPVQSAPGTQSPATAPGGTGTSGTGTTGNGTSAPGTAGQ